VLILRRNFITSAVVVPVLAAEQAASRLKIVVAGGHPGDPECGCAGTVARYTSLGHEVVLLYLNRDEGYCKGADPNQCGVVRTDEARKACEILKARAVFARQVDGRAVVDNAHYDDFGTLLEAEKPDIVFAQWPVDQHRDHRALSMLVLDAWLRGGKKQALYYYEVFEDTMMFAPTDYVDISAVEIESQRRAACYAHASQDPDKWYPGQVALTRFRGTQSGHAQADGFLRHWQSRSALLP
jgi:LmbE family N-acetylglucosaminyl deacetylase